MMREKCGIFGVLSLNGRDVSPYICQGLYGLQHRGQESCGIYAHTGTRIVGHKSMGLVQDGFSAEILARLKGSIGVGHVRYSTTAGSTLLEAQPFYVEGDRHAFALAFNGTITNFIELRRRLREVGYDFETNTDTEALAKLILHYVEQGFSYEDALEQVLDGIEGACSLAVLDEEGNLYAARDPLGFKPLAVGSILGEAYLVSSEGAAIEPLGGRFDFNVMPGEIVRINSEGIKRRRVVALRRKALCMFEYVYFARPDSVIDGISVYEARYKLGRKLAQDHPANVDIVVPVPDSGRTVAHGYSDESGAPLTEGLIKNRYVWRTFIMPGQELRELSVKLKLNAVRSVVEGKRVALLDDSIVRGTTMRHIVRLLKQAGAREVHVRISCPPIVSSCYMGIDFPTRRELIASKMSVEEICRFIEADSLGYQTLEGLLEGIGLTENDLCLACLTGRYPLRREVYLEELEAKLGKRFG